MSSSRPPTRGAPAPTVDLPRESAEQLTTEGTTEQVASGQRAATPRRRRTALPSWGKALKVLRRVHMYTGLLLLPWILLFGVSGILFNHPNWGEKVSGRFLPPPVLRELTGISPWNPSDVARDVVAELNRRDPERGYAVDPELGARFSGYGIFAAPSPDGRYTFIFEAERGAAILSERKARPEGAPAPFIGQKVPLERYSMTELETKLAGLLEKQGNPKVSELRAHPALAPQLEYRMVDRDGTRWNVSYDTSTGELRGRRIDTWPSIGASQLLTSLHKTHHYTMGVSARWMWALFQDLLGITMVFWAVSGLFMWWQMKPTRLWGALAVTVALGVGLAVMYATASDITFAGMAQELGPGD